MLAPDRRILLLFVLALVLQSAPNLANADACAEHFARQQPTLQLACLGEDSSVSPQQALAILQSANGQLDHRVVAGLLDRLRLQSDGSLVSADDVAIFLRHEHALYRDRDRWEVVRLRAQVIAVLTALGFPESAMPLLEDSLMFIDETLSPVELGTAIRAAAELGPRARRFLPAMLSLLSERLADEEFSLERYSVDFSSDEVTTIQIELLRAAGFIALPTDTETLATLQSVAHNPRPASIDPRAVSAARDALRRIDQRSMAGLEQTGQQRDDAEFTDMWLAMTGSTLKTIVATRMIDHNGRELRFGELMDMPLMLCFFYTRCQNAGKCSTTVSRLAFLQRSLRKQGLDEEARLIAITLEPDYDTPDRIRRFVQDRGLELGTYAISGGIRESDHSEFLSTLDVPVGYSAGWVNTHAVLAVLIDANTQTMRRYLSGDWLSEQVTEDIVALKVQ